jgi:ribosomal-protein-alanine N-acetyltransferase
MTLLPITPELEFDCSNYETVSGLLMEVIESTLERGSGPPWCGYLALTQDQEVVGTCAFKGPPDERGEVELAWFTFPHYENRGVGTRMARLLVELAEASGDGVVLVAHTLPEQNSSTRICEHAGFTFDGEVDLPEDGTVWRWRRG